MNGERDPTFLRCALQKPKERRMVLRLEAELQRLRNSTAPSLEMQPMSAYNASLVEAVAAHFGLRVSSAAAHPAAVGEEPLVRLTLLKTEASAASPPPLPLSELVPAAEGRGGCGCGGVAASGSDSATPSATPPRVDSADSLEMVDCGPRVDASKVQLMRRTRGAVAGATRPAVRLTPDEVEARHRQKEAE
eukprot:CAMPEP_0185321042 /NCGR_PEP_ID=MMETSP1363-20130426/56222_1 /TAXON_ID=38817 /ORGANISM="Gephyrocapsa oceanica, Strain RCC1303" /LENGTH=190 /DNA_ID=CAMNT_0027919509 /DNA_START=12 /DNA_END=581 /DNA_ORIENTATION=-